MNKIVESNKYVVTNSTLVSINYDVISDFSKSFNLNNSQHWLEKGPIDMSRYTDMEKLHFIFIFNVLSFSYWGDPKWSVKYNGEVYDGSWAMIACIARAFESGVSIFDMKYLSTISDLEFRKFLDGNIEIPLFEERLLIIREVATVLKDRYKSNLKCFFEENGVVAINLVDSLVKNFPSLVDTSIYKEETIYFQKRAQLLLSDIYEMFDREFINIENINELTACADYKLPQALRKFNIISYSNALAEMIDNKIELPQGSNEETEIRAATIIAIETIRDGLKNQNTTAMDINDYLWLLTQDGLFEDKPYHRVRTTAY